MAYTAMIGMGSGFAGDRSGAAIPVIETLALHDGPRFLIFETLAERTLALAQIERESDAHRGEVPSLQRLVRPVLGLCAANGVKIIGNFGAANPRGAAMKIRGWLQEEGLCDLRVAVVEGDDVRGTFNPQELSALEVDGALLKNAPPIVAANAYLGAGPIAEALGQGADIVVTGRVADPSLILGPLIHAFGWAEGDLDLLAAGVLAGHLLECGGQVTGGYFADPGIKDVEGLDCLGYPLAEVKRDGSFTVSKPPRTGGRVDRWTVIEQMLYEIHDPENYLTPDVTLDLSQVEVSEVGLNRVVVTGALGKVRPPTLKATVCIDGGFLAEAEISYAGPNALARAELAADIIGKRMARVQPDMEIRVDFIGFASVFGKDPAGRRHHASSAHLLQDIRVRFASSAKEAERVQMLLHEVEALYCVGPAGGGGVRLRLTPRLSSASCLVPREAIQPTIWFAE